MIAWILSIACSHTTFALANNASSASLLFTAHTTEDHGGGAISSSIAEDSDGSLFIANESGLLKFDGNHWHQMPATGYGNYVSSVAIDHKSRIWISSPSSIGHYTLNRNGSYDYTDLTYTIDEQFDISTLGTFWKIYTHNDNIYLITTEYVLRWNGERWKHWHFDDERRILPNWVKNKLYVHARGTGLFRLDDDNFNLIAQDTPAIASGIISILKDTNEGLLCATVTNGFHRLKEGDFTAADIEWHGSQIIHAKLLRNGALAISSAQDGIRIIDQSGALIGQTRHDNNPIYESLEHSSGSIWAVTTSTILEIPNLALTYHDDQALDIVKHQDALYYTNSIELKKIDQFASGTWAPQTIERGVSIWSLHSTENDLLYGDTQTFGALASSGDSHSTLTPRHVAYFFDSPSDKSLVYTSDAPKLSRWRHTTSGWQYFDSLKDFNYRALSLVELPNSQLLVACENSPLLLVNWKKTPTITKLTESHGLPEKFMWAYCLRAGENIIIISDRGLFRYDSESESFHYDPVIGNNLGTDAYALESCLAANGDGWILYLPGSGRSSEIGHLKIDAEGQFKWRPMQLPSLGTAGKVEALLHEHTPNSAETLWVGGNKKLLRYDLAKLNLSPTPKPRISSISEQNSNHVYFNGAGIPTADDLEWKYPQQSLVVEFVTPPAPIQVVGYQTRLLGFQDSWTKPSHATLREFTNLPHGDYSFQVRAIDEFGRTGQNAGFSFTIRPPWYLTPYAYVGYVLLAILLLIISNTWRTRTLRIRNEQLEALVNKRTYELEDQKLKLINANKAKQNFLASMSHEIRNPLNGIVGIAQILQLDEAEKGQVSEQIQHLNTCSKHLHQLISQTLDYSSLEAGKIRTRIESFDPTALLSDVIQIQQSMAQAKGLQLILNAPEIKFRWKGDPVLLRQILINLISNGIKYTPSGTVSLNLSYQQTEDSIQACFEVLDTGPGIPKDREKYIFEKFTRLPESEKSQIPGTGLGLAISVEMARLMDGSLQLDSEHQGGARFILELEFGIDLFKPIDVSQAGTKDYRPLAGQRILVADDMDFNRYISVEVLRGMGAITDEAENGLVALNKLREVSYDIAILDINMPKMSGPEAVENFLQDHTGTAPEFIALSAYNTPEMEEKCLAAGFNHFAEKPLAPDKLEKLLNLHYSKRAPTDQPQKSLLSYLSDNTAKPFEELCMDYKRSFEQELENLRIALLQQDGAQQQDIIHKLLGLCRVNNSPTISQLTEDLSIQSKLRENQAALITIIEQLNAQLNEELGS